MATSQLRRAAARWALRPDGTNTPIDQAARLTLYCAIQKPNRNNQKRLLAATAIALGALTFSQTSNAQFSFLTTAQEVTQLASWATQYAQMVKELAQLKATFDSLNGIRGMADLVNNPALRKYLPADYKQVLDAGYGNWQQIQDAYKLFDASKNGLPSGSDVMTLYNNVSKQRAVNEAMYQDAYKRASQRFDEIQVLLDKVNDAPDAKDMADLQGRIQAEQVMMANEQSKLQMLTALSSAQEQLRSQQATEISMKFTHRGVPTGW